MLCCVALRCVVLWCGVLCCVVLCCGVLCCAVLCCVVLCCVVLSWVVLCWVVLCCVVLRLYLCVCDVMGCVVMCCKNSKDNLNLDKKSYTKSTTKHLCKKWGVWQPRGGPLQNWRTWKETLITINSDKSIKYIWILGKQRGTLQKSNSWDVDKNSYTKSTANNLCKQFGFWAATGDTSKIKKVEILIRKAIQNQQRKSMYILGFVGSHGGCW